tara:strand:- start:1610 stop:2026 length:417 start_codon:yes stop_codon:yes gene_type:complete
MPAKPKFKITRPADEKITVNIAAVDLGQIDLLVQEGFYATRTEFIRTAIRNHIATHADVIQKVSSQQTLVIGLRDFTLDELESVKKSKQSLDIKILGLARFAPDITPALVLATISSISVLGAIHASPEVKKALLTRVP